FTLLDPSPPLPTLFPYTTLFRSILLVACPRNHHNLQREVAGFWRPLRILGRPQHRRQIPFKLDSQSWLAGARLPASARRRLALVDRKSTRLNSSHRTISYAVFCL